MEERSNLHGLLQMKTGFFGNVQQRATLQALLVSLFDFYWQQNQKFNGKYWQSYFCVTSNNSAMIGTICETGWSSQYVANVDMNSSFSFLRFASNVTYTDLCRVLIINNPVIINYKSHIVFLFILVVSMFRLHEYEMYCILFYHSNILFPFTISPHTGKITHLQLCGLRETFWINLLWILHTYISCYVNVIWATHCINIKKFRLLCNAIPCFYAAIEYELCAWFYFLLW